ncbi:hypothetical protein, partial [Rhodanobacter sp. C01]|uniref:hypothetical protein n=1 Tax=Rhodanobacter sp. C01 TaxID=1945856 RepID=UPI001C2B93A5
MTDRDRVAIQPRKNPTVSDGRLRIKRETGSAVAGCDPDSYRFPAPPKTKASPDGEAFLDKAPGGDLLL